MLFGKKELFAIEAELEQGEKTVFIRICYWINNSMIGDLDQNNVLTALLPTLKQNLDGKGKRNWKDFVHGNDASSPFLLAMNRMPLQNDLTDFLIEKIWLADDSPETKELKILDMGSNESEAFQGFYMFLVEFDSFDSFLTKDSFLNKYDACKIPKNEFYKHLKSLYDWVINSTELVLRKQ